jgi:hypothetical protein
MINPVRIVEERKNNPIPINDNALRIRNPVRPIEEQKR